MEGLEAKLQCWLDVGDWPPAGLLTGLADPVASRTFVGNEVFPASEFKIIVDVPIGGQKRLVPKTEFKKINETLLAYVKNFPHSIRPFDEVLYDS